MERNEDISQRGPESNLGKCKDRQTAGEIVAGRALEPVGRALEPAVRAWSQLRGPETAERSRGTGGKTKKGRKENGAFLVCGDNIGLRPLPGR